MLKYSLKTKSDLVIPVPKGLDYFPFQKAGIEYAFRNPNHNTLIGDEPGLGKTIQFIGFCNVAGCINILVICPASLVRNWAREIAKWHTGNPKIQIIKTGKDDLDPKIDVHIVSYSLATNRRIHKFLQAKSPDALCIDEVHYLKNPEALRTKAVYLSKANLVDRCSNVIALSGTPIVNRPKEIFTTAKKLAPMTIDHMSRIEFAEEYCGGFYNSFTGVYDDSGASNMKKLGTKLREGFMVRRLKKHVLKELPEKLVQIVELEPNKEAQRIEKEMQKEFSLEKVKEIGSAAISFEGISTMRKELGIAKIKDCLSYIKNQLDSGREKVVVFAHHKEVLITLAKELNEPYGSLLIYGGTKLGLRQDIVDQFQKDPSKRVFVGSIGACGEGLTLTAADYLCFVEPDWVPGKNDQVIDRVHRIGQVNNVLAEFLVYPNSLDGNILESQTVKAGNIKEIMG